MGRGKLADFLDEKDSFSCSITLTLMSKGPKEHARIKSCEVYRTTKIGVHALKVLKSKEEL